MDEQGEKSADSKSSEIDYSIAFLCISVALCTVAGAYVGWRIGGAFLGIVGLITGVFVGLGIAAKELKNDEVMLEIGRPLKYIGLLIVMILAYVFTIELSIRLLGEDKPYDLPFDVYLCIPLALLVIVSWIFAFVCHITTSIWPQKFRRRLQNGTGDFSKLDLRGLDLKKENLKGKVFRGSVLSGQDLEGVDLSGADLTGADLSHARLRYAKLIGTCLNQANLRGADMGGADLTRADIRETNLRRVNLKDAILRQAKLQYADFKGSQSLRGANFEQADLANADLFLGILREANFKDANLTNANLRGVNLINADLTAANVTSADFRGVGLEHPAACLKDVNLEEAKLNQANLQGVIDVTPKQLLKASSLDGTTMLDGTALKGLENPNGPSLEEWIEKQSDFE